MSLIDPREAEARKTADLQGTPAALAATIVAGLCVLLSAALIGFAAAAVFDQFRITSINSVFSSWDTRIPVAVRGWGLPLGIIASIFSTAQYAKWNHRFTGRSTSFAGLGPLTIVLLGLTAGIWLATTLWTEPDAVGVAVDPTFSRDEPWDVGGWVLYSAKWWLPGLFALLTVLSLVGRVASGRQRSRRSAIVEELIRTGALVDAEVLEAPLPAAEASRMAAALLVSFTDRQRSTRFVRCTALLRPSELPPVGAHLPLLFDPAASGDVKRIFLSPTGGTSPEDFQPVTAAR